jgi:dGTPase
MGGAVKALPATHLRVGAVNGGLPAMDKVRSPRQGHPVARARGLIFVRARQLSPRPHPAVHAGGSVNRDRVGRHAQKDQRLSAATKSPAPAFRARTREEREQHERHALSPIATLSTASRGRRRPEPADPYRTCFEVDRDRILNSKALRRLRNKTQVFLNPPGDHEMTRLTHTLLVAQVARQLAAALSLNEPLTEAIAMGHDVGHSPFGHTGEDALAKWFPDGEWHHAAQGLRIFEKLEDLNLSWEVLDGIRGHSWKIIPKPVTPESHCVRFADRIAYLAHDAQDAMRLGVLRERDFPAAVIDHFGPPSAWMAMMTEAVIANSLRTGKVSMDRLGLRRMNELRDFMFERVYHSRRTRRERKMAIRVIRNLVQHYLDHPAEIPASYRDPDADALTQAIDLVTGMTDRHALETEAELRAAREARRVARRAGQLERDAAEQRQAA